jgi:hypothetical protein
MAENKSVIMMGMLLSPIDELSGHTIGLGRMRILDGYLRFPAFAEDKGCVSFTYKKFGEAETPVEIQFQTGSGHIAKYRLTSKAIINDMINVPPMEDLEWGISFTPTQKNLSDLKYFSQILGSYESYFNVITEDNKLQLGMGGSGTDGIVIPFVDNITSEISPNFKWPLAETLSILRLSENTECTMEFSSSGGLRIIINSGLGLYTYILPAIQ